MSSDLFTRLRQQIDEDVTAAEDRKRRRRKKRRNSDCEDDENKENIMPKWKMCLVGAAIFTCFALLYPSVFSPMLNNLLGRGGGNVATPSPNHDPRSQAPRFTPSRSHMHPGAAAQMRMPQAEATQQSGRGGIFSWMLPIYTVGMVAFLLYTFFKPKKAKKKRKNRNTAMYLDESSESDDEGPTNLLGRRKLNSVQQRLYKTETAMRQILEQLESLASQANSQQHGTIVNSQSMADGVDGDQQLSPQQIKEMERSLQELKILSDLCKEQRSEVEEAISEEEEGQGEEDDDDELLSTNESEQEDGLDDEETDDKEDELKQEQQAEDEPQPVKQDKNKSIRKRVRREK